jgi:hypothetical protein
LECLSILGTQLEQEEAVKVHAFCKDEAGVLRKRRGMSILCVLVKIGLNLHGLVAIVVSWTHGARQLNHIQESGGT